MRTKDKVSFRSNIIHLFEKMNGIFSYQEPLGNEIFGDLKESIEKLDYIDNYNDKMNIRNDFNKLNHDLKKSIKNAKLEFSIDN